MTLVIKTGQLAGPTSVSLHAEVQKQKTVSLPAGDKLNGKTIVPR